MAKEGCQWMTTRDDPGNHSLHLALFLLSSSNLPVPAIACVGNSSPDPMVPSYKLKSWGWKNHLPTASAGIKSSSTYHNIFLLHLSPCVWTVFALASARGGCDQTEPQVTTRVVSTVSLRGNEWEGPGIFVKLSQDSCLRLQDSIWPALWRIVFQPNHDDLLIMWSYLSFCFSLV